MTFYCPPYQKEGFVCVLGIVLKIERCHMYLDIKVVGFFYEVLSIISSDQT